MSSVKENILESDQLPSSQGRREEKRDPFLEPVAMDHQHVETPREIYPAGERDIIYSLRQAHAHQTQLLILADQKANILLGIVTLVVTLVVANQGGNVMASANLGLLIAAFLEVAAIVLALLVVVPRGVGKSKIQRIEDVPDVYHFCFIAKFEEEEYINHLFRQMKDSEDARELIARNFQQVSKVLAKKYACLRWAYISAAAGLGAFIYWGAVALMP